MKLNRLKRIVYLLILIVLPLLSFGNDVDVLFAKGNGHYAKGQYEQALGVYKKILAGGAESGVVYFNMGNAYYKIDDIPSALLYYEKAHKLLPNDEDINFNIMLATSKTIDKIEEVPEFFLSRWWKSVFLSASSNVLAIFSIVFMLLGTALLILYFFVYALTLKKAAFYSAIVFFILCCVTNFMAISQVSYFDGRKQAIVFTNPVTVKSAPNDQSKLLFVIHEGAKVSISARDRNWVKVSLANGNEGWMKATDLREI